MINASAWNFLFHNLTTGVVFQDNSGAITQVNSAAERVLGLTEDQMKGKTSVDPDWQSIRENGDPFPGDEHPAMVALRTGKPVENVIMGVYQPEKKQVVWININSIPYFDKRKSEPSGVFSTFEDITEKKKTQEELIHSHKELTEKSKSLEALFNSQSTYVLKTDLHGFVTYANPAYVKMFFSDKEKQGILGSYGMDSIMPYHHDRVREVVSLCITHPGKSFQLEIDKPGPNGLARTSLWDFIAMIDDKGHPTEILCTGIDVYELKKAQGDLVRSEEKYRSLVEESDNLILVIDRQGTLQYCNKRVADLVGLNQYAIPNLKLKITDFYRSEEQLKDFERDMYKLFHHGESYSKVIQLFVGERSLWIKGTATPIFNDDNKVMSAHVTGVDVTELRIKEERLQTSEKRYRSLIESMDAVVVVFDADGNYILVNEKGTQLAGSDKAFFEGKNLDISFSPEEAQLIKNRIKEVLTNNSVSTVERCTTINGKEFWFRSVIQPIEDEAGDRKNVLYISYDITDQKTAQSKIQESESKYRSLIESSDAIIAMFDLKGVAMYANDVASRLVGLTPEEALRKKFRLHDIFPNDRKHDVDEDIATIVKTRKGINEEVQIELGGREMYFKSSMQPVLNEKNEVYAILLNATDMTELKLNELKLKESEEQYRSLIESSDAMVLELDLKGYYLMSNQKAADLVGLKNFEMVGKHVSEFHPKEEVAELIEHLVEVGTSGIGKTIEKKVTINGKEYWNRSSIQPIRKIGTPIESVLLTVVDSTEQKEAELRIKKSETNFKTLFDESPQAYLVIQNGKFVECNKAATKLMTSDRDYIVGKRPEQISPKTQLNGVHSAELAAQYFDIVDKKGSTTFEWTHTKQNGETFLAQIDLFLTDYNGQKSILCLWRDITEERRIQEQIKQSEENFRTLFYDSPQAYLVIQDGVFIDCNKASEKLMAAERKDIIGMPPDKISPEFQPNGRRSDDLAREYLDIVAKEGSYHFEWKHVRTTGEEFLAEINLFKIKYGGKDSIIVLWRDITLEKENQLKIEQSEANFRNLFFDSPQAYVIIQDGIFVDCNRASEILMESTREELIGISPDEISPEFQPNGRRSTEMAMEYIENAIRLGHIEFEWTHIRPNGKQFLAEINLMMSEYNGKPSVLVLWRDITDEKRNQKVVQQLSQIVNQSPVSIIMTDIHGHIEYINKATTNNLGYSFEDVKGLNPSIWKSGNTDLSEYEQLWETVLSGKKWRGEFLNKRKDGELVHESSTVFPIFDSNQTITNLVAIQEDITERKKAEADLRLFQTVFDSAVNGRLITDLDGNIIYCNQYYADMHHASKDEIIGSNCLEQVSDVSLPQYQIIRKRLLQTGTISAVEIEHKRKDGHTFPGLVNSSVIRDEKGKDKYISITILDISDRKQIENEIIELNLKLEEKVKDRTFELQTAMNRLETFFEVSLDMLCIADQNGRFIKLSKAFEDVLHYTRKDLEGQELLKFIHPEDIQPTIEAMQTLQGQSKVISFVNRYRTAEGDYRFIEWYSSPVGEYVYAVARDITDRKERELELINARKIAEDANASKSVFLSRMSHELRTPMNSILGFAQLLEMSDMNEMQESSVQHILHSGKHLLGLINEVLDIARIETGKISLSIEQVNVTDSLKEVCALLEPLSQRNAVDIVLGETFNRDLFVHADQQRTVQIMTNLINNAIKYNRNGGKVFIEQSLVKGSKGQEMVHISIKDTGIGIKQEDLGRLFTPFERIGAQNSEIEGTGLGLAVVKELVAVLGGELGVNSVVNEGSEFWIDLPKCTSEEIHTHEEIEDELMKMEKNSNIATILYVEDNAMNISLVEDIFHIKRPGYHLVTTTMGSEAMDLANEHHPQLILLDLDLPDIHGSLVLKQLKEDGQTQGIPVIVVSADATKDQIKNLIAGGAERYITKPFDITEFLSVIDMYIEN